MNSGSIEIISVSRSAGALRRVAVSSGKVYLVLKGPHTERFLEQGAVLDRGDIEELEGAVARDAGMSFALRFLARRERTEHQLRGALMSEGIENQAAIDYIVETLRGRNLINDRRFASELIDYRMKHNPAGPALLRRKLAEAGVAGEVTGELLEEAFPEGREREIALSLAVARLSRSRRAGSGGSRSGSGGGRGGSGGRDRDRLERERAARRISGFLSRRGFSAGIAGDICAAVLRGDITGESDDPGNDRLGDR